MSYGRSSKKEYEQPLPSTGPKRKLGSKPKGQFEKDLIRRSTEATLKVADKSTE